MRNKLIKLLTLCITLVLCVPTLCACGDVSFTLTETDIEMSMYEEYSMPFKLKGANRSDIVWSSSDSKTATVRDGVITAKGVGSAVITGTIAGKEVQCSVLVSRNKVGRALSVSESEITLEVGDSKTVTATFKESSRVVQTEVVWESSLPNVVSVENGKIIALARGNAVVSAYTMYKGQSFTRDITVRSTVTKSAAATLSLQDSDAANSSLAEIGSEKTDYGFFESDTVYRYQSEGGYASRIFANGAYNNGNVPNYDRLMFKVKFTSQPQGTVLWLANYRKQIKGMSNLATQDSCFLFYDASGKIAKTFDADTLYTVVINLNKAGDGETANGGKVYNYGFALADEGVAYVGGALLCSEDYFIDNYDFEQAEELPALNYIYAETGGGLNVGTTDMPEFDKYWVMTSSGTSAAWANEIWNDRVAIGGLTFSQYRKYEYMRMDIMFESVDMRYVMIWTGGYSVRYEPNGSVSSSEASQVKPDDLRVYLGEDDVTGTPLQTNKVYTFRIRVQRDNLENVAFGINVNSETLFNVYLSNPTFTDY